MTLVFEIAADRASLLEAKDVRRAFAGIVGISALEIDRHRNVDRRDDSPRIGEDEIERHLLAVAQAQRVGQRVTPRRDGLAARFDHHLGTACVPNIVKDDRVAGHVERRESGEVFHSGAGPFCCHNSTLIPSGSRIQAKLP